MKKVIMMAMLVSMGLMACSEKGVNNQNKENMTKLELAQEWDKVFPLSEKVSHQKVTFETQYGFTLVTLTCICRKIRKSRADCRPSP